MPYIAAYCLFVSLLLPICEPRAGIPSKTDHRVRKLTYTHTHPAAAGMEEGASQGECERGSVIAAKCMILRMCIILSVLLGKACLAWPPCPSYSHNFSMLCLAEYTKD